MKFKILNLLLFLISTQLLIGQNRIIKGRVISEELKPLRFANILDIDNVLIGETDSIGNFEITIKQETQKLFFYWIGMEETEIKLQNDCNIIEVIMTPDAIYDFISSRKIDRLRKKIFNQLPKIHSNAFKKGIFSMNSICYIREFKPDKPILDSIGKVGKLIQKNTVESFKKLSIGDTIRIPYAGTWILDGTDRKILQLTLYSNTVERKNFDYIINGVITKKNKRNGGFNIVYKVIDTENCSFKNIILDEKELKAGELIELNLKSTKVLYPPDSTDL